jgi:hypothetical protein
MIPTAEQVIAEISCFTKNHNKECKTCELNTMCNLDTRLEHIEMIHTVKRIFIRSPELYNIDDNHNY